jgi:hypothetical protein
MRISQAKSYFFDYHRLNSKKKYLEELSAFTFKFL